MTNQTANQPLQATAAPGAKSTGLRSSNILVAGDVAVTAAVPELVVSRPYSTPMKSCTYCGKEYPDAATVCAIDGQPLGFVTPASSPKETSQVRRSNEKADNGGSALSQLRIDLPSATLLGLLTLGIYWGVVLKRWARANLDHRETFYDRLGLHLPADARELQQAASMTTFGSARITVALLASAVSLFLLALFWEEIWSIGAFPVPEVFFWLFGWVALASVAVTARFALLEACAALEQDASRGILDSPPWLPLGGRGGVNALAFFWAILALGLLPLIFFPPVTALALNKYARIQENVLEKRILVPGG